MAGASRWLETESLEGETHKEKRPARLQGNVCQVEPVLTHVRPPTAEPDAGDPLVRFGGRGRLFSPYPYLSPPAPVETFIAETRSAKTIIY
jgi:hypothetical protein